MFNLLRSKLTPSRQSGSLVFSSLALAASALLSSPSAHAHIKLMSPASWVVEGNRGDPQKAAPCGGDSGTTTGAVTTYRAGDTITVTWQETIGHPGHFRISLATDRADLIDPPVVTTNGDGVSGNSISAEIMNPVAYPVLLDGLFPRATVSGAQAAPFSQEVTLPDETCEKCTLQVIQFMTQHAPGYFYHHCADIQIVAADAVLPEAPVPADGAEPTNLGSAGSASTSAAGAGGSASSGAAGASDSEDAGDDEAEDGGCTLASHTGSAPLGATLGLAGFGLGALLFRRSRR